MLCGNWTYENGHVPDGSHDVAMRRWRSISRLKKSAPAIETGVPAHVTALSFFALFRCRYLKIQHTGGMEYGSIGNRLNTGNELAALAQKSFSSVKSIGPSISLFGQQAWRLSLHQLLVPGKLIGSFFPRRPIT